MISKKDDEDVWLIKYGVTIPLSPNGNSRRSLEISFGGLRLGWYNLGKDLYLYI